MTSPAGYPSEPPLGGPWVAPGAGNEPTWPRYPTQPPLFPPRPVGRPPSHIPPPPPGGNRNPWNVMVILVAGLVATVLILAAVIVTDDDDSQPLADLEDVTDEAPAVDEPEDEPEPEPEPEPEFEPGPPPTEEELEAVVADITTFVEQERGLEFVTPVDVELADDDAFVDRLIEASGDQDDYYARVEVLYKAFGLVGEDTDFAGEVEDMLGTGVVGFYNPETKELVVRATALTPFARTVIAHELTHALDDQHFNLNRPEYEESTDEISFGFSAMVEGDATFIEQRYHDEVLTEDEQDEAFSEELDIGMDGGSGGMPDVSFALFELMGAPYIYGPELIDELLDEGGQERLDAAFGTPPTTSEQVLSPDKFLAGEAAAEIAHPTPDGELVMEGVLGQLFVQVVLDEAVDNELASDASEGWGGDWAVVWRDGERSCMRVAIAGDTPADNDELQEAWSEWAADHSGTATSEQPAPGSPITLTSCSS